MGNYKTGNATLFLKEIPPFLEYHEAISKDTSYGLDSNIVGSLKLDLKFTQCEFTWLQSHFLWVRGERIEISKDTYQRIYKKDFYNAVGIVELNCSSKDFGCVSEFMDVISKYKKYLVTDHPNILGEFCDEDGWDNLNFTIVLDNESFKLEQLNRTNTVCFECPKFKKDINCCDYEICKSVYDRGITSTKYQT